MQQSVQCSEGRSWVLRADLNDAMENKSIRERRVLCYLWCYGKQECQREKGSLLLVVLWKTRV